MCILIHTVHWYMATCAYHELTCHQKGHLYTYMYIYMECIKYIASSPGHSSTHTIIVSDDLRTLDLHAVHRSSLAIIVCVWRERLGTRLPNICTVATGQYSYCYIM